MTVALAAGDSEAYTIIPTPAPPPVRDLGAKLVAEAGILRVWQAASVQASLSTPSLIQCPDRSGAGGALVGAGAINSGVGQIGDYLSNMPGVMIGQDPTVVGKDRSMRLYRQAYSSEVIGAVPTIPASGAGVSLKIESANGFGASGTAIYAPGSGAPQTIAYTSVTGAGYPSTKAALNGCTCAAGAFTPTAGVNVVPSSRTQFDPFMQHTGAGAALDFATPIAAGKAVVFAVVVRPADALHRGIGGSGTGDESGVRRTLNLFSVVASGAPAGNPGAGQAMYADIVPNNANGGLTGHVRFGYDAAHEVVLTDAIQLGRSHLIVCQYDPASGNTTVWVGQRGAADVVSVSANIGGPGSAGAAGTLAHAGITGTYHVANFTQGGVLRSFHGFWGLSAILTPATAWTLAKVRSMWIEAGLNTRGLGSVDVNGSPNNLNGFNGAVQQLYTPTIGKSYAPAVQTVGVDTNAATDNPGSTWRGTTRSQQAPLDFATYLGGGNIAKPNTNDFSAPLYIVDESTPEVEVSLHTNGGFRDQEMAFQMGVPIPPDAMQAMGTDSQIAIWRPSTDEYWDMWSGQPPWFHTGPGAAGINTGSFNNGRWNAGFAAWQSDMSRLKGPFDGGYSRLLGSGGWGASAPKIPYGAHGAKISALLAGDLNGPVFTEGSLNFATPTMSLLSSTVNGGASTPGIAAGQSFLGRIGDTITLDQTGAHPGANGMPQYGLTDTNAGTVTAAPGGVLPAGAFTLGVNAVDNPPGPDTSASTQAAPSSGTITVYADSGPVNLTYTAKVGTTGFAISGGGAGQAVSVGAPWIITPASRSGSICWGLLKIGTDYFSYGLIQGNTFLYVQNVSNAGNTGPNPATSGALPAVSVNTTSAHGVATSVTRQAGSNNPAQMPWLRNNWPWPGNNSDGHPNSPAIISEGCVLRIPGSGGVPTVPFSSLPAFSFGSWARPSGAAMSTDTWTPMLYRAAAKYGVIVMDIAGSTIPIESEDPWEWMKVNGMNPYNGSAAVFQATGPPVAGALPIAGIGSGGYASLAAAPNGGTGGNAANTPSAKAFVVRPSDPTFKCSFSFNAFVSGGSPSLTNAIGDANFASIQAGDWIMAQGTSTWVTGVPFASTPAGYQALFPSGVPAGVPLFAGITPSVLGQHFPWDQLEMVDPVALKAAV